MSQHASSLTALVVLGLVAFGVYRKNRAASQTSGGALKGRIDSEESVGSGSSSPWVGGALSGIETGGGGGGAVQHASGKFTVSRSHVARVALRVQGKLGDGEMITLVHDYSAAATEGGIVHTMDVATFNTKTTQALCKRIQCLERGGELAIQSVSVISPIAMPSGASALFARSTFSSASGAPAGAAGDGVMSELLADDTDADADAKLLRDEYVLLDRAPPGAANVASSNEALLLPPEPERPGPRASAQDWIVYNASMALYREQVEQVRAAGAFTGRGHVRFVRTNGLGTVADETKYPFSQPTSYGFAEPVSAQPDYNALKLIQPLPDEGFFDSLTLEKSTLALQYP